MFAHLVLLSCTAAPSESACISLLSGHWTLTGQETIWKPASSLDGTLSCGYLILWWRVTTISTTEERMRAVFTRISLYLQSVLCAHLCAPAVLPGYECLDNGIFDIDGIWFMWFFMWSRFIICVRKEDLVPFCLQLVRSKTKEESTTMIQLKTVCVLMCVHACARVCICAFSLQNFTSSEVTFITYFLNLSLHWRRNLRCRCSCDWILFCLKPEHKKCYK